MKRKIASLYLALVVFLAFAGGLPPHVQAEHATVGTPIRFGLTAVVVRENLRFLDQWSHYLSKKLNRPVTFVRRRSYREIMNMLEAGSLEFAWICGYPFVQKRAPETIDLMAVPVYKGKPTYHSYIIVHKDSPYQSLDDLGGKVFAFSDPDSNSGFLYPQFMLAEKGENPETYFRQTFFTFNHTETVEAVAEHVASGGAVDSYIWDYLNTTRSPLAGMTRVIHTSPAFGFPPLVSRRSIDPTTATRMKQTLLDMSRDPEGHAFLDGLKLNGFDDRSPDLFDDIREMSDHLRKAAPWFSNGKGAIQQSGIVKP